MRYLVALFALSAFQVTAAGTAFASSSADFDRDCGEYYRQGLDPDVSPAQADAYCSCLAGQFATAGLGEDALDFFARTYSDDLTTFIHEYPKGEAWMEESFKVEPICKGEIGTAK